MMNKEKYKHQTKKLNKIAISVLCCHVSRIQDTDSLNRKKNLTRFALHRIP